MFTTHWSLRTRLVFIAGLALLLGAVPGALLLRDQAAQQAVAARQHLALPANQAWQTLLSRLQAQRSLAAAALSTQPDSRPQAVAASGAVQAALQALDAALGEHLPPALAASQREQLSRLRAGQAELAKAIADGPLDVPRLLDAQTKLAAAAFDALAALNAATGLLLDAEPAPRLAIDAGLVAAPQVQDALSELAALALAAAVDDTARMATAHARYREHATLMQQRLQLALSAADVDTGLAQRLQPLLLQARQQREQVDATLAAAAADISYPLEHLAARLAEAGALQARLTGEVMAALDAGLAARAAQAALQRHLLAAGLAGALLLMLLMMRRALRLLLLPVQQMVEATERIAAGDLSQAVPAGREDELGRVLGALGHMQQKLRHLVEHIHADAGGLRHAAQDIASGNQNLAQRTEIAAAHLQQTAAHVQALADAAQHSSGNAQEAERLAASATAVGSEGGRVVGEVVATMRAIEGASGRIADITGLIDALAFQTNILALNAAVEAARAGEHGRGFAVVAAEVRTLAQRSAQAAREIRGLIAQSTERVAAGTRQATDAGAAVDAILAQVRDMATIIQAMARQARAEAAQTAEVGVAVRAIDTMTQQNAALVEQAAAAADSLRAQAAGMDTTVNAFRL